MSHDNSDTGRLAELFDTDESGYNPAMMSQIGSGVTHPKNAVESDGDSPDSKEGESSQ